MSKLYITATTIDADNSEDQTIGWIDWNWSPFELHAEKEDVRYIDLDPEEDERDMVENILGAVEDPEPHNPRRYYAIDSQLDEGRYWSYCAHVED